MQFALKILGSNSAFPTTKRFSTAQVLRVHERFFLIDCGEGTQIQLRRYKIPFGKINDVFISHLHGDHYFGIFGILSTFSLLGRKSTLNIYAPSNLKHIIRSIEENTDFKLNFNIVFHDLNFKEKELIFENKSITVESIPLQHRVSTCGFVFREKERHELNIKGDMVKYYNIPVKEILKIKEGADFTTVSGDVIPNKNLTTAPPPPRSYAFCSDTVYTEKILPYIKNVDILYHEATFAESERKEAHKTKHTTAAQAATIAKLAEAKKLVIGHFSSRYMGEEERLLNEAISIFPNTIMAFDGLEVDVPQKKRGF